MERLHKNLAQDGGMGASPCTKLDRSMRAPKAKEDSPNKLSIADSHALATLSKRSSERLKLILRHTVFTSHAPQPWLVYSKMHNLSTVRSLLFDTAEVTIEYHQTCDALRKYPHND